MGAYQEHVLFATLRGLEFEGYNVPTHTQQSLENYYFYKLEPGGFLGSLIAGDSTHYLEGLADHWNRPAIPEIQRFVREQLPPESFGSWQALKNWINSRFED
jgi:hypothetical protein